MKRMMRLIFGNYARRMMLALLALSLMTISILSVSFYIQGTQRLFGYVEADLAKTLQTSSEQINRMITTVENVFIDLLRNRDLYAFFRTYETEPFNTHQANALISKAIGNHTLHAPEVLSVQFLTSKWIFSENNTSHASVYNMKESSIYKTATESKSRYTWMPTYDYTEAFHHELLQDKDVPVRNRYVLSLVGIYEPYYYFGDDYSLKSIPPEVERPVLTVNVRANYLKEILLRDQQNGHGKYLIVDESGVIMAHEDDDMLLTALNPELWAALNERQEPSGHYSMNIDGENTLVYYAALSTGWRIVAQAPERVIRSEIIRDIGGSLLIVAVLVLVLCSLLGMLIARQLSHPLNRLLRAIEQTGQGHFDVVVQETNDDFNRVIRAYNDMNRQIHQLIEDIYVARIREKEMQMMALKYQTNPHFLNNALTILLITAEREGTPQTAQLIYTLSEMMKYVVRDQRNLVSLEEELENIKNYMVLIDAGYEGNIRCEIDVDPLLMPIAIPKLCLQPLMENAVMHGLHMRRTGGVVRIEAVKKGDGAMISVRDNGEGMPEDFDMEQFKSGESMSIGLYNVHTRIQLLFGAEYGLSVINNLDGGACVIIRLPINSDERK